MNLNLFSFSMSLQNKENLVVPKQGVWDMRGNKFFTGIEIRSWAIACFAPQRMVHEDALKNLTHELQKVSRDTGMPITAQPFFCKYISGGIDDVEKLFHFLKNPKNNLQLVVVVLPGKTPVS